MSSYMKSRSKPTATEKKAEIEESRFNAGCQLDAAKIEAGMTWEKTETVSKQIASNGYRHKKMLEGCGDKEKAKVTHEASMSYYDEVGQIAIEAMAARDDKKAAKINEILAKKGVVDPSKIGVLLMPTPSF